MEILSARGGEAKTINLRVVIAGSAAALLAVLGIIALIHGGSAALPPASSTGTSNHHLVALLTRSLDIRNIALGHALQLVPPRASVMRSPTGGSPECR